MLSDAERPVIKDYNEEPYKAGTNEVTPGNEPAGKEEVEVKNLKERSIPTEKLSPEPSE